MLTVGEKMTAKTREQGVGGVDVRGGQGEKSAQFSGHPIQEPTAPDIGKQRNGDFWHANPGSLTHHPMTAARENPQATAHHHTVPPTDNRLGIGVQDVIHPVLTGEKILGIVTGATGGSDRGIPQGLHVTPGAKRLVPRAINDHGCNGGVIPPGHEPVAEHLDHIPGQGIQGLGGIQGQASYTAGTPAQNFDVHRSTHNSAS